MSARGLTDLRHYPYVVVGGGVSGCVMAERIASVFRQPVLLVERRERIGGNSRSEVDPGTGIECHCYGSHIFHTRNREVWDYIRRFAAFTSYRHKVLSCHRGRIYQMPINLKTINDFYGVNLKPGEVAEFLRREIGDDAIGEPGNLEEKAVASIGRSLYDAFIRDYTRKQWACDPRCLPASIINRLPVRSHYNADYFGDPWQGVPRDGYGALFDRLLADEAISVLTGTDFADIRSALSPDAVLIYTGMPDQLFDFKFGALKWRSLRFETERMEMADYQGNSVVNYPDMDVAFTRIHEFKHFHPERAALFDAPRTVICREYPCEYAETGEAYYPVNDQENNRRHALYAKEAAGVRHLYLLGRLAEYKYLDMDQAVAGALALFDRIRMERDDGN